MEKLIKLLNEYEGSISWGIAEKREIGGKGEIIKNKIWCDYIEEAEGIIIAYLISKEFGFIKWLVENDKIDIKELVKEEIKSGWNIENVECELKIGTDIWNKYYSELCIMLLSISDSPIDDLVGYLK